MFVFLLIIDMMRVKANIAVNLHISGNNHNINTLFNYADLVMVEVQW